MNEIIAFAKPRSKAIAAFIAGVVVMFLTKHNVIISDDLNDAIEIVLGAIITALTVYFSPKNKETN
jgi:fructose-specific phosphotransferase system IIC component